MQNDSASANGSTSRRAPAVQPMPLDEVDQADNGVGSSISTAFDALRRYGPGNSDPASISEPEQKSQEELAVGSAERVDAMEVQGMHTKSRRSQTPFSRLFDSSDAELPVVLTDPVSAHDGSDESFGVPVLLNESLPRAQARSSLPHDVSPTVSDYEADFRDGAAAAAPQSPLPPSSPPRMSSEDQRPSQSLTALVASSSPPPRRKAPSSPLPPSSPPRDTSSPAPDDLDHPQQAGSSSLWDQPELDSIGEPIPYAVGPSEEEDTTFLLSPEARAALRRARGEPTPEQIGFPADAYREPQWNGTEHAASDDDQSVALPIAGSGPSAYSDSDYYTSPSDGSNYAPQPADARLLTRVVNSMASLSGLYRSHLDACKTLVEEVHNAKKDAIIGRRLVAQETAMSLRLAHWLSFWDNSAKKWHDSVLWNVPLKLQVVHGKYVEESSEDDNEPPHGRTELKQCWEQASYRATRSDRAMYRAKYRAKRFYSAKARDTQEKK